MIRAALLATTCMALVAPGAVFQKTPTCCYLQYLETRGPPTTTSSPGSPWELWEGQEELYIERNSQSTAPADVMLVESSDAALIE